MHRAPRPQDQARILEKAFAEHGVKLVHRQALDLTARLQGYDNWQAWAALEPQATARAPEKVEKALPAEMCYVFEAECRAPRRAMLDYRRGPSQAVQYTQVAEQLRLQGFTRGGNVDLCEADDQGDENIQLFVTVRLYGRPNLPVVASNWVGPILGHFLDVMSRAVTWDVEGRQRLELQGWHLSAADAG